PSHDKALQGLLQGEVSMLTALQPSDVDRLQSDGRFFVQRYALPVTHLIQFHPRSKPLRSRELRRALGYGLNRLQILQEEVLKGAPADRARLITGPYPKRSVAENRSTPEIPYDPAVSTALALAARKALGGKLPELTLLCDPDPIAQAAARICVAQWAERGLTVRLVSPEADAAAPESWDLCYRLLRMAEPSVELWPLLTLEPRARVESLRHLPHW